MVFQDPESQFCMLNVEDEVAFGLENLGTPPAEMDARIAEALQAVGLADRRRERSDRLSGGQKQRLALACALARRPALLFLDEPTSNLDPQARHEFFGLLRRLKRQQPELTIIIVEHILDELIELVDHVLLLGPTGTLAAAGAPAEVFERDDDLLDEMGIWLPQAMALGRKLRRAGLPIGRLPLTVAEAIGLENFLRRRRLPAPANGAHSRNAGDSAPAARVRGLSFAYGDGPLALRDVSLEVPAGAFFALAGANGSGKTTLAAHLADILRPPAGRVWLFGDDAARLSTAEIAGRVGYVFQNPEHQFVESRVEDELAYSLRVRRRPPAEVAAVVEALLEEFDLAPYRRSSPFALSQGQKRRLSVATMLGVGQKLLVLDEPTFGQDRHTAHALMERLSALWRAGVTILMITHDLQMVADYAGQTAVLAEGQVRFAGPTPALFADAELLLSAALRPLPLHALARALDVAYDDGTPPLTLRDWLPFFGLPREAGA